MLLLSSTGFSSKNNFFKNSFRNPLQVSNNLNPDQDRHFVGPDLASNCLQRLSADEKVAVSKQRVNERKIIKLSPCPAEYLHASGHNLLIFLSRPIFDHISMLCFTKILTLKAPIMTAADDNFCAIFPNFQQK